MSSTATAGAAAETAGSRQTYTASVFYRLLERSTDILIPVDVGDFRLMSRRVSDIVAQMPERDRFIRGMVASVGFKQVPFSYDRQERYAGSTKYPLAKMIQFATDAFLGFSMVLLRFSSVAAFGLLLALIGVAAYSIYAWAFLEVVPGWTSLMITIIVVSFFQLIVLSVIGEHVGRIYLSTKTGLCSLSTSSSAAARNERTAPIYRGIF
jgi:polyisoprenyl-phosphate glycosyltransferase